VTWTRVATRPALSHATGPPRVKTTCYHVFGTSFCPVGILYNVLLANNDDHFNTIKVFLRFWLMIYANIKLEFIITSEEFTPNNNGVVAEIFL
jgi:hypothetical protein